MSAATRGRVGRGVLLLGGWALVVAWLTWPLAAHLRTHLPDVQIACRFDALLAAWAGAHETRALTSAPATLLDAPVFYPARRTLLYCEAGFGALPVFLPTFLASGNPALALNLTFLLSLVLTATVLHAVVTRWTGSELGGALAAWAFLMTRWTVWGFAATAPNYAVLQYLPLIMLMAATPAARFAAALRLVPLIVLQSLTSIVYLSVATFAPLGMLATLRLTRRETRAAGLRLLAALGLAGLVLLPLFLAIAEIRTANPRLEWQTLWVALWPRVSQPITRLPWGSFVDPLSPYALPASAFALIGLGAVSLCLRGRGAREAIHPWAHGLLWAFAGVALSLTPTVYWGERLVELPQVALARWVPAVMALRVPARIGVAALMGFALLVGAAFAELARRLTQSIGRAAPARLASALVALVFAAMMHTEVARGRHDPDIPREPLPVSYPIAPAPMLPEPLAAVIRTREGPLLELPLEGRGLDPIAHAQAMYRQIFHRRPLLNGYCGYWPKGFRRRMLSARRVPDAEALATLRSMTGVATILVHTGDLASEDRAAWAPAVEGRRRDLRLLARAGDDLLFAVAGDGG